MKRGTSPRATMNISGGTFIGSAVGSSNKVSNNIITVREVHPQADLDHLRKVITAAREELLNVPDDPNTRGEVHHELSKIEEELNKEQPHASVVCSRWERIHKAIGPLAAASSIVTQITDLINKTLGSG